LLKTIFRLSWGLLLETRPASEKLSCSCIYLFCKRKISKLVMLALGPSADPGRRATEMFICVRFVGYIYVLHWTVTSPLLVIDVIFAVGLSLWRSAVSFLPRD
jgi:hypothetical protein